MPAVSAETRNTITERIKAGDAIAMIATDLGLSRATVYKYAPEIEDWLKWTNTKSKAISRLAYEKLERAMSSGDARLALDWLKVTDLAARPGDSLHVHGDVSLVQAVGFVPSTASTPTTPSTPSLPTPTEAAKTSLASPYTYQSEQIFSKFSDEQLEQELARRKAARSTVIDAEVVDAAR